MGRPLIGDGQMLAMHAAMLRLREGHQERADLNHRRSPGGPQLRHEPDAALLAATLLQLRPGDTLVCGGNTDLAREVLAMAQEATFSPDHTATLIGVAPGAEPIFAAGHAFAQAASTRPGDQAPVTVALVTSAGSVALEEAMRTAGAHVLPLVLLVEAGAAARAQRIPSRTNVEVVRVDAADAVACCRVMQESLLRARNRWGSVVLQGVHLPGAVDPVIALEAHLRRRSLQF